MRSTAETASKQRVEMKQALCLLGKMPKAVFTFLRLFVLLLGFTTICLGVLCTSTNSSTSTCRCGNSKLVFYCLLALGFFLLVTGIFWSTFHEVLKYRGQSSILRQNHRHGELRVSTIDRPEFYPPSYEDSIDPEKQTFPLPLAFTLKEREVIHIPPLPYSESSTEFISETYEQEQPPPYELSVQQLQQQQRWDQDSILKAKSHLHPSTLENSYQWNTDYQETSDRAMPVRTCQTGSE
ncbi:transmembrane protein 252 [Pogoniulus pusillus]|uniref:transmembrane protein 252 n=1 Tax=Pogoniulus pusillus TaxID=488313 RepID=UPI0030B984C7